MSRLLLIHCPVNPRLLNLSGAADDVDFSSPSERFRWCLIDTDAADTAQQILSQGQGTVADMPFADEAMVLIPTVDVRLIHTRVPMISGKKLEAILPTLAEPYLIDQRTPLRYQAFPPQAGASPIERTIAVTSDSWMSWLEAQLAALAVRRLSMIPDCLLLDLPQTDADQKMLLVNQIGNLSVVATREGADWGAGWIEAGDVPAGQALAWAWLTPRACSWLKSKSTINLILQAPQKSKQPAARRSVRWQPKVEWALWRQPIKLTAIVGVVYLTGSLLYLSTLALSHWRWDKATEEAARQHLNMQIAANAAVVPAYIKQATSRIHAQGKDTAADFIPMAAKLQALLASYPSGLLDSATYQPEGLRFRLKNTKGTPDAAKLIQHARRLELALVALGRNEYLLQPYAGLIGTTVTGAQP